MRFRRFNPLRALAALGVLAAHMTTRVALFFVISGFLLYRPFAVSLGDRAKVKLRYFAANRFLRIVPLYFVVLYCFSPTCGLAFALLVALVAFSGSTSTLTRALSWRPLVHLGDVSYGIYLWHEPLHRALFNMGVLQSSYLVGLLEVACCTVALATGTYYLIEKPALRIKNRWAISSPKPAIKEFGRNAIPVGVATTQP